LLQGKAVKASGGFFTVLAQDGGQYFCRARGMLKQDERGLMVGDWVLFEPVKSSSGGSNNEGVVEKLLPRKNFLPRPPVANVDQLMVVMSLKQPECDWKLVSRMLILAEKEGLSAIVCLNKIDLLLKEELDELFCRSGPFPYKMIFTSAVNGRGLDDIKGCLSGQCSVLAGPSGVGKSTLLNAIQPGLALQTGPVSDKIKRGKHTTRQVTLLPLETGGTVADTPGFTRLDLLGIEAKNLADYFPEFDDLRGQCAFRDCLHINEPKCAVHREVGNSINSLRYEHYTQFVKELNKQEAF